MHLQREVRHIKKLTEFVEHGAANVRCIGMEADADYLSKVQPFSLSCDHRCRKKRARTSSRIKYR